MFSASQLPVSADQPNAAALQAVQGHNLPYNPPFFIQLQSTPHLQQYAPYITGCVLVDLINNATKNQLRTFYFNLLSNNNWQTQEFNQLVQLVASITDYLMMTRRMRVEEAAPMAVAEASPCYLANIVLQYRQGLERYITPQLSNDLNTMLQKSQQWNAELQRYYQSQQSYQAVSPWGQPQPMYPGAGMGAGPMPANMPAWMMPATGATGVGGYPPPRGNYGAPMGGYGYGYGQPQQPAMHAVRPQGPGMFSAAQGPAFPGQAPPSAPMGMGLKPRAKRQDNMVLSMSPDGKRTVEVWNAADGNKPAAPEQTFAFQPPIQEPVPAQHPMSGAVATTYPIFENPANPLEGMTLEDGTQVKLASKSSWKVSFTLTQPYRTLYDRSKFVLLHVRRPDGTVTERLEPITEDIMKYLDHELDPTARRQAREQEEANQPPIVPTWQHVQQLRTLRDNYLGVPQQEPETLEAVDASEVKTPEVHSIEQIPPVHSLKEAQLRLAVFAKSAEIKPGTPVEFHFDVVTPVTTSTNLTSIFKQLETCVTYEELQSRLYAVDEHLDDEVRTVIDQRLTSAVNEALQKNLGMQGWRIDSFKEDYQALLQAIKEDHGDQLVEIFQGVAPEIIGQSLSALSGEGFARYLENVQDVDAETAADILLALRDRTSITLIPQTLEELRLGNLREGGMIPASEMPELQAAVAAIFERSPDFPVTFARRYLQTADKKLVELRRGYLNPDAYLLFEVQA